MPNISDNILGTDGIPINIGDTVRIVCWRDPYVTWDHDVVDGETFEEFYVVSIREDGEWMIGIHMYRYLDDMLTGAYSGYTMEKIIVNG